VFCRWFESGRLRFSLSYGEKWCLPGWWLKGRNLRLDRRAEVVIVEFTSPIDVYMRLPLSPLAREVRALENT
jgi:hypothetical protein